MNRKLVLKMKDVIIDDKIPAAMTEISDMAAGILLVM